MLKLNRDQYNTLIDNSATVHECQTTIVELYNAFLSEEPTFEITNIQEFIQGDKINASISMITHSNRDDYEYRDAMVSDWVLGWSNFEIVLSNYEAVTKAMHVINAIYCSGDVPWLMKGKELSEYFEENEPSDTGHISLEEFQKLPAGVYRFHWLDDVDGGTSVGVVFGRDNGSRDIMCSNWTKSNCNDAESITKAIAKVELITRD